MTTRPAMGGVEWLLLIALSLLWGGSFFFTEVALAELPPFTVVLGRVGLAAAALLLMVLAQRPAPAAHARALGAPSLLMGALNNLIPFSLIVWGQTAIASGLAAILNATTPLFTVVLAHRLTARRAPDAGRGSPACSPGCAGVVLMIGPAALEGLGGAVARPARLPRRGAVLRARRHLRPPASRRSRRWSPRPARSAPSTLLMLPLALLVERPWTLAAARPGDLGRARSASRCSARRSPT